MCQTEIQDSNEKTTSTCNRTNSDEILASINKKLETLDNVQGAFKDMEKKLMEKLLEVHRENTQLKLDQSQKDLAQAKKTITELRSKSKEPDSINCPQANSECPECPDHKSKIKRLFAQCSNVLYANRR
jgi:hypothetical protein